MSKIQINIPQSLYNQLNEIAEKEGVSIDQFVATAVAEKLSALMTEDYLGERARRGRREEFERVMAKVSEKEPPKYDKL